MGDIFKVATNIPVLNTLFTLDELNQKIAATNLRMASGKTVTKASDDPATFLTSRLFETSLSKFIAGQVEIDRGIDFLEKNAARLDQVADIIIELDSLANTAKSGAASSAEKQAVAIEMNLLLGEIDHILQSGVDAKLSSGFTIANLKNVSVSGTFSTASTLGLQNSTLVVTGSSAQVTTALSNIASALTTILNAEETVGAYVKRLEFEMDSQKLSELADRSALSTIVDADLAKEQVNLTSYQILQRTAISALIQANSSASAVLGLLGS